MDVEPGTPVEGGLGLPVPWSWSASPSWRSGPAARFYTAIFLSLYGDWLSTVALLVVLLELTHTPAAPAGYMLVRVGPRVFGPWLGGRLTDRFSPRAVLIVASAIQGFFTASLIVSHRTGAVWAIFLAVAVAQFAGALGRPSQGALLPGLVAQRDLPQANATYGLFFSTSMFVAPAIGAALLPRVGPDLLFTIDAATFVMCAVLVATLPRQSRWFRNRDSETPENRRAKWTVLLALRRPPIRMVAVANFASGMTVTVTQALLVVAAHERYGGDASVGYLYSSVGVGGAIGGLVALRWIPPRGWTRFAVLLAITVDVVAIAGFSASSVVLLALLMLAVSAAAGSSFEAWGLTEVQRQAPPGLMGRFNSIIFISMYSGMLVGAVWALGTSSVLHWDVAIQVACAAMLVLVGLVWLSGGSPSPVPERKEP